MSNITKEHILFFDDACILCNKSIRFIHFLDIKKKIFFCPLKTSLGIEIQKTNKLKALDSTVIYYKKGTCYTQSSAIIHCLSDSFWLFKPSLILLLSPSFIRNKIYELIARNRTFFFKNRTCSLPSDSLRKQILVNSHNDISC